MITNIKDKEKDNTPLPLNSVAVVSKFKARRKASKNLSNLKQREFVSKGMAPLETPDIEKVKEITKHPTNMDIKESKDDEDSDDEFSSEAFSERISSEEDSEEGEEQVNDLPEIGLLKTVTMKQKKQKNKLNL